MGNVAAVTGALVAGVVGGSLSGVTLAARPAPVVPNPVMPPGMAGMMAGPSGASMVMPPGYGPGVMMTSGESSAQARERQSADGLKPLAQPAVAPPIPQ